MSEDLSEKSLEELAARLKAENPDEKFRAIFSMQIPEVVELTEILGSEDLAVKAVEYFGEDALIARRKRRTMNATD